MRTVNKVILVGNLTRNPELKETQGGQKIVTFGLATNREWRTTDGEKHESAEFTECIAWSKLAEICNDLLRKGNLVYVEGYLKTRAWDLPDGTRKHRTEVVVEDMIILEKRGTNSGGGRQGDDDDSTAQDDDDQEEEKTATPGSVDLPSVDDFTFEG